MSGGRVHVLDDDGELGRAVGRQLEREGYRVAVHQAPGALVQAFRRGEADCLLTDMMMDGMGGFEVARRVRSIDGAVAILFMTAWPRTADAVDAIRELGGVDYLEKPIDRDRLLASVAAAVDATRGRRAREVRLALLTAREREVLDLLVRGHSSKMIAARLAISVRTIDDHRASIMKKSGATSLADLVAWAG